MQLLQVNPVSLKKLSLPEEPKSRLIRIREAFFEEISERSWNTKKEYNRSIGRLSDFMKEKDMEDIECLTEDDIREFQLDIYKRTGNSACTVHYYIKTLRRYCTFLVRMGHLAINPFKYCDSLPSPERITRPKRYYSHQETLRRYFGYLKKHYGYRVSNIYIKNLQALLRFLEEKGIKSVCSVEYEDLAEYPEYLWNYRQENGKNYTKETIRDKLEGVKKFYRIFFLEGLVDENPSKRINVQGFLRSREPDTRPRQIIMEKEATILDRYIYEYKAYIATRGFAERTINLFVSSARLFGEWLGKRSIKDPKEITKHTIIDYYKEMYKFKGTAGKGWSASTKYRHLTVIRKFLRFMARMDYIEKDPTEFLELPKQEKGLPTALLKDSEVRELFKSLEVSTNEFVLRDKAIMELLYSTGIRANELSKLSIKDIDFERQQLIIRHPKGGRSYQRVVPFGTLAERALKEYIETLRPNLIMGSSKAVFLSNRGNEMNTNTVREIIKEYARKAGVKNSITTHSFRVGCATEMLRSGADVRYVQTLLGHKRIETTQIYTRVNIEDLKRIHKRYHPREKFYRKTTRQK